MAPIVAPQPGWTSLTYGPHDRATRRRWAWRRYLAKGIDVSLALSLAGTLAYVVSPASLLRVPVAWLLGWIGFLLYEGYALHHFGTTVGKYLLAISVLRPDGTLLDGEAAQRRSWRALVYGRGLGLPIVTHLAAWRGYKAVAGGRAPSWDADAGCTVWYGPLDLPRQLAVAAVLLLTEGLCRGLLVAVGIFF